MKLFTTLLTLAILAISAFPAYAKDEPIPFTPVSVLYLVKDPNSALGYKERMRWSINSSADWERFYTNLLNSPLDKTVNPDPLKTKVEDMIVLSRKDANKVTGFDIYVSSNGIMAIHRDAKHAYYPDTNKLWAYLKQEQNQNGAFDTFSNAKIIDPKTSGIIATYNINQNIANPSWSITDIDKIKTYDSFFMALKPFTKFDLQFTGALETYDKVGNFILNLNYPNAPANVATITQKIHSPFNSFLDTKFYQDREDYYNFFKSQAREMINYNERNKDTKNYDLEREF